jgi:hypothetical protein
MAVARTLSCTSTGHTAHHHCTPRSQIEDCAIRRGTIQFDPTHRARSYISMGLPLGKTRKLINQSLGAKHKQANANSWSIEMAAFRMRFYYDVSGITPAIPRALLDTPDELERFIAADTPFQVAPVEALERGPTYRALGCPVTSTNSLTFDLNVCAGLRDLGREQLVAWQEEYARIAGSACHKRPRSRSVKTRVVSAPHDDGISESATGSRQRRRVEVESPSNGTQPRVPITLPEPRKACEPNHVNRVCTVESSPMMPPATLPVLKQFWHPSNLEFPDPFLLAFRDLVPTLEDDNRGFDGDHSDPLRAADSFALGTDLFDIGPDFVNTPVSSPSHESSSDLDWCLRGPTWMQDDFECPASV